MDEPTRQYFEIMKSLMAHPGWKVFMDDVAGWKDAISSQWRTTTPEGLRFAQGRFDGLDQIHTFETTLETLEASAIQDALDAATI